MSASLNPECIASDLATFVGDDEERAREAFSRLWAQVRSAVFRQLARGEVLDADRDDVAQNVSVELWQFRRSVRAQTAGEWYALTRKIVGRVLAKARASASAALSGEFDDVPDEEMPYLDAAVVLAEDRRRLYEGADDLWLGRPASEVDVEIRTAAIQLLLVEGLSRDDVAAMFGTEPDELERWLEDPALVSRAIYAGLCWPGEELAGHVLRPERPLDAAEMNALLGFSDEPETTWPRRDARVICWRLRHGLREDQIVRASQGELDRDELEAVLVRIQEALPFRRIARSIRAALEARGRSEALTQTNLWMRIAFEYAVRDELPPRQISERAVDAAEEATFRLDSRRVYNWVSAGRLYTQLTSFLQKRDL